jgi:hypothetical protein
MPRDPGRVRDCHLVVNVAVVTDVGVRHHKHIVANSRETTLSGRPVDGHVLAEDVIIPYFQEGRLTRVFSILGIPAYDSTWPKPVVLAD